MWKPVDGFAKEIPYKYLYKRRSVSKVLYARISCPFLVESQNLCFKGFRRYPNTEQQSYTIICDESFHGVKCRTFQ